MSTRWKKIIHATFATSLIASVAIPSIPLTTLAAASSLSVAEAIANQTGTATVKGYIVGFIKGPKNVTTDPAAFGNTNFAIADDPNETDTSKMLFIQLPKNLREEWALDAHPVYMQQQVTVTGDLKAYFSQPGLKNTTNIDFVYAGEQPTDPNEGETPTEPEIPDDGETQPTLPEEPETPSTDVQTIATARTASIGQTVTVKGIVTAKLKNTIAVQDKTGGMAVRPTSLDVAVGDEVVLTGTIADFNGLVQLDPATVIEKTTGTIPAPKQLTGQEVNEANESRLATVNDVTVVSKQAGNGWTNYTVEADGATFIVRDERNQLNIQEGMTYASVTGIVQQFKDDYQIIPRNAADVVTDTSIITAPIADPAGGTYTKPLTVTLTTATVDAAILYTVDGSDVKNGNTYAAPISLQEDTTLQAVTVKEVNGEKQYSEVVTFDYKLTDQLQIHDVQGAGHQSPFAGQTVTGIEGVITYKYTLNGRHYYHIQTPDDQVDDDPRTSEGIVLYSGKNAWPVDVGDLVTVTGKVSEYAIDGFNDRHETDQKVTQINVREDQGGNVIVKQSNVALPKPIVIDETNLPTEQIESDPETFDPTVDAIDFWESLEGMRVQVGDVKAVAPQEHGDVVTVLKSAQTDTIHGGVLLKEDNPNPHRIQFRLEPNRPARDFEVATGDTFNGTLTGVVGYSFQNYKIYIPLEDMQKAHQKGTVQPEQTTLQKQDDQLTIAAYNLENFSNNGKTTSNDKANKLARAFVQDMQNPDIIGVTEVQDNNGPDQGDAKADQSYQRLIRAIQAAGGVTYEYVNIDPQPNQDGGQPNANIRVGFLYNPERVQFAEGTPAGDATTAVGYEEGRLTHNPGRIDPMNPAFENSRKPLAAQFNFQGEDVIVIVNHWNSKRGDTPLFGSQQPPVYKSENQRKEIATIVADFVNDIKTKNPAANIVSVGDFNDFQWTDALKIHEGDHLTNMINELDEADRYTYIYQGNSQVLDHIFVSNNLKEHTTVDILHMNADFTDRAGRASDHDPVLVQIDLKEASTSTPEQPQEPTAPIEIQHNLYFKNVQSNKVVVEKAGTQLHLAEDIQLQQGIVVKAPTFVLKGQHQPTLQVTLQPTTDGVYDLNGIHLQKLIVDGAAVKELRHVHPDQQIEYMNGASAKQLKIHYAKKKGSEGTPSSPTNNAPTVIQSFPKKVSLEQNEAKSFRLSAYFTDHEPLTYTTTHGQVIDNVLTVQFDKAGTYLITVTASDGERATKQTFIVEVVTTDTTPVDLYYAVASGKTGAALKATLHDIISEQKVLSYDEVWSALKVTDEDPNNPNNVILLYSQTSRSKSRNGGNRGDWNREHVWAKSHGNFGTSKGPGTDIHHLRPTDVQVNGSRGNLDFDEGGQNIQNCSGCKRSSNSFEPPDEVKGDVARMLFYMAVRYEAGDRVDLELNDQLNNGKRPYHGKLSTLLKWHEEDPVSEWERQRNDKIHNIQGNRNPFIDHPEWATSIWGTNDLQQAS